MPATEAMAESEAPTHPPAPPVGDPSPPGPGTPGLLFAAFVVSGVAGLVYEVAWTRYLALFVGHSAFAQVLVLVVYLGGMAVGSLAVSDLSRRLSRPLLAYAGVEAALAVLGLLFHPVYVLVTEGAYDSLFPALGSAGTVGAVRWGLAAFLILPQSVLLGTTFPLMAAGLVRSDRARPGRGVATVYLANALGGAAGVVLAGFVLIGWVGLDGTVRAAAVLNLVAAALVALAPAARARRAAWGPDASTAPDAPASPSAATAPVGILLTVAFGTALASFAYEIAWIRMLSLVLGAATHAFELMLSAFVLGLGVGAWVVRGILDRTPAPLRLVAGVQWLMGLAALATIPLYLASFPAMAALVGGLPGRGGDYLYMNLARYALALLVMLPATFLAGMALPAITGTILRGGGAERVIGRVYAVNTLGSVVGAVLAGLVLMPILGVKGLLVAAAGIDLALGVLVFGVASSRREVGRAAPWGALALATAAVVVVAFGVRFDRAMLTGGVYRYGAVPRPGSRDVRYYRDGRTATVGVHEFLSDGLVVLTTNGKPDASMDGRWFDARRDTLPVLPIPSSRDAPTQVFAPLLGLAHRPGAETIANIGHGSGMSAASLLTSPLVERIVTIEIEPAMVEGSTAFLPANQAAFIDPRSTFVFDDAKSWLSYRPERFDLIFSEPSNPWVSGTSSLFTREFYRRIRGHLAPEGVLVQWLQLYELDDPLVLSVLAALSESFPWYRGYLLDTDLVLVASANGPAPEPDWSVFRSPALLSGMLADVPRLVPDHLEALYLFDQSLMAPALEGVASNSDFDPILDLGAERARFVDAQAHGTYSLGGDRLDLWRTRAGIVRPRPEAFHLPAAKGLEPAVHRGLATWLGGALAEGGGIPPAEYPEWQAPLDRLGEFLEQARSAEAPADWSRWATTFQAVEQDLHWTTALWADTAFYGLTRRYVEAVDAPDEIRTLVDLRLGLAEGDFGRAAPAVDRLMGRVALGDRLLAPAILLDAAVLTYLGTARPDQARRAFAILSPLSGREEGHLRLTLLDAWIREAEAAAGGTP